MTCFLTGSTSSGRGINVEETGNPYSKAMPDMIQNEWFHGRLSREECEQRMRRTESDCFLVRESANLANQLTLSLKNSREVRHFLILRGVDWFEVDGTFKQFSTMPDLVNYYRTHSITTDSNDKLTKHCPKTR